MIAPSLAPAGSVVRAGFDGAWRLALGNKGLQNAAFLLRHARRGQGTARLC